MADAQQFEIGNRVRLKSGGPLMTVLALDAVKGAVHCTWFDRADTLQTGWFASAILMNEGDPK